MPRLPSEILPGFRDQYSARACFAFDWGAWSFVKQFRRMAEEVEWVEESEAEAERKRKRHMKPKPKYELAELQRMLGIDARDPQAQEILAQVLDPSAWDDWVEG